jgi:DinB family protein
VNPELLTALLAFDTRATHLNLEGLTHADALVQPPGGGNCVNWMLGHIVTHRNHMLRLLGRDPVWGAELDARYDRGSKAVTGKGDGAASLETLLDALERARLALEDAFRAATPGQLDDLVGSRPLGQMLVTLLAHELYHAGQIGVVRRYLGRPGAIK